MALMGLLYAYMAKSGFVAFLVPDQALWALSPLIMVGGSMDAKLEAATN